MWIGSIQSTGSFRAMDSAREAGMHTVLCLVQFHDYGIVDCKTQSIKF